MFDPFWSLGPTMWDYGAGQTATEANNRAGAAELRVRELEHRVERLALACNAMWSLLRTQTGLTDQQLQAKIQQIDAVDGARHPVQCGGCGRQIIPRHGKCMYCGTACGDPSAFDVK